MHRRTFFQSLLGWGAASAAPLPTTAPLDSAVAAGGQHLCPRCGSILDWPREAYALFGAERLAFLTKPQEVTCPQIWRWDANDQPSERCGWRGVVQFMRRSVDAPR